MRETMRTKLECIQGEIARLSEKISKRIEELENETIEDSVITYRNDTIIHEAMGRVRSLYHKGREICARYHLLDGFYNEFKNEPRIFRELDLSETCARARAYLKKTCLGD